MLCLVQHNSSHSVLGTVEHSLCFKPNVYAGDFFSNWGKYLGPGLLQVSLIFALPTMLNFGVQALSSTILISGLNSHGLGFGLEPLLKTLIFIYLLLFFFSIQDKFLLQCVSWSWRILRRIVWSRSRLWTWKSGLVYDCKGRRPEIG